MLVNETQRFILVRLSQLHDSAGMIVADFAPLISWQRFTQSNRQHSNWISGLLHDLEAKGLVQRADDARPILWQVTTQGARHG